MPSSTVCTVHSTVRIHTERCTSRSVPCLGICCDCDYKLSRTNTSVFFVRRWRAAAVCPTNGFFFYYYSVVICNWTKAHTKKMHISLGEMECVFAHRHPTFTTPANKIGSANWFHCIVSNRDASVNVRTGIGVGHGDDDAIFFCFRLCSLCSFGEFYFMAPHTWLNFTCFECSYSFPCCDYLFIFVPWE